MKWKYVGDPYFAKYSCKYDQEDEKLRRATLFLNHLISIGAMNGNCEPGESI
jgi:hypothetical protein